MLWTILALLATATLAAQQPFLPSAPLVRVREQPNSDARVIASLSFAILPTARPPAETDGWTAVQVEGNRTGYIASRFVRSPIDYRAIFRYEGRGWKLVTLVAGD